MSAPSAPTTSPAPHLPFRWHERLLPALVFHVSLAVTLAVGFALQQLLGPIVLLALVQLAAGVGTLVALVRWMNLRLLAAGHPHTRIEVFIGPLLLVGVVVSLLGWPLLNELRELPLFQWGPWRSPRLRPRSAPAPWCWTKSPSPTRR